MYKLVVQEMTGKNGDSDSNTTMYDKTNSGNHLNITEIKGRDIDVLLQEILEDCRSNTCSYIPSDIMEAVFDINTNTNYKTSHNGYYKLSREYL